MAAKGTIELQDLNGNPITPEMIQSGDTVIAIATPPDGYEYNRWVDNGGNTITDGISQLTDTMFRITVECGVLYKVIFKKVGDDTCSVDVYIYFNNGVSEVLCTDCGTVSVSSYYCNGQAVIEAVPTCCYEFIQWSDGNTSNPRTVGVTIGSHLEYRAIVKKTIYDISVQPNDQLLGKLSIGDEYGNYLQETPYQVRCGEKFMLKAIPQTHCTFTGWQDLSPSNAHYRDNPRVVTFDCTLSTSSFDESPLTNYIANFEEEPHYRIRYHSGTAADNISNDTNDYYLNDTFVTKPSNTFSYASHTFVGWYLEGYSGTTYNSSTPITLTQFFANTADANNVIHMYAAWSDGAKCKITYDRNGGDGEIPEPFDAYVDDSIVLFDGESLTHPDDKKLVGWCTDKNGIGTVYALGGNYTVPNEEEVTLFACWASAYIVKYNPNGGEGDIIVDNNNGNGYNDGDTVTVYSNAMTNYSRENYTFRNWNTSSGGEGTTYTEGSTFAIEKDMLLYAIWTENETSTLSLYNADGTSVYSQYTGYVDNVITLGYVPTLSHHTFLGWATSIGGSVVYHTNDTYTLVSGGSSLYAVWTAETTYTVTYNGNGSTSGSQSDSNAYYYGDTATVKTKGTLVKSGTPYGCAFKHWYTNAQGTGGTAYEPTDTITVNGNITLYAQWECCRITFGVNNGNYGSIDVNGTTVTSSAEFNYEEESQIDITILPASGYAFIGWIDNTSGYYLTPNGDVSCTVSMDAASRYAYIPVTPTSTPSTYGTTTITTPTYTDASAYTNTPIVYNSTTSQYFQCVDLAILGCATTMNCSGTYTATFVPCEYGNLSLCDDCGNGYEYVESDTLYFYNPIDDVIYEGGTQMTPTDWRDSVSSMPSPVTADSPMYLEYNNYIDPVVYYKKTKSGTTYSYTISTYDDYIAPAQPQVGEDTPMYVYDNIQSQAYYKIAYNGTDVTNVTKAYTTIPTEYLGDIISWFDYNTTQDAYYSWNYGTFYATSGYNTYYEWNTSSALGGYTLIPASQSYYYQNDNTMSNVFFNTKYQNYTYININGSKYKWNGTSYQTTTETSSSAYSFVTPYEFITSYKRYDASANEITSFFLRNASGYNSISCYKWMGNSYVPTTITTVFKYDPSDSASDRRYYLNGVFPIDKNGIHYDIGIDPTKVVHFGDTLNFSNDVFVWNTTGTYKNQYTIATGTSVANATAHVYGYTPQRNTSGPDEFIGTYIMYDGSLMKLKYYFDGIHDYTESYEATGFTVSMNNIIGSTGTSTDGLYVTAYSVDAEASPVAMSVSAENHIADTYGTPTQYDPEYVMVESVYYIGGKTATTEPEPDIEFPSYGSIESTTYNFNNIPSWRVRTGLTDGNPTENMYIFPNTVIQVYFKKHLNFKLFRKQCQSA